MKIYKLYNQIFIESAYPNNVYQRLMPKIDISSLHQLKDIEMNLVP